MDLKELTLNDKAIFEAYLNLSRHELSAYAFENIYIWKQLFKIQWAIIQKSLCVFLKDNAGCFLYLGPLTKKLKPELIKKAFEIMDHFNCNPEISRIENVEEKDLDFYHSLGYTSVKKPPEYLCLRHNLVGLRGNAFKSKRASVNYFCKNYNFQYLPFRKKDKEDCLKLYRYWKTERKKNNPSPLYRGMLEDSLSCLKVLLDDYDALGFIGRAVKIDKKIKAFTFGFKLNNDTFCILYEIADLAVGGLAQFIFRQFSSELKEYQYINIMDDSGLENLRRVKLSYRPFRLIPAYIIKR
jgi:hypothetical protein